MLLSGVAGFLIFTYLDLQISAENVEDFSEDYLTPYTKQHGSHLNHRQIRECQPAHYNGIPYELVPSDTSTVLEPLLKRFIKKVKNRYVKGHYSIVSDPLRTISILEPKQIGGCELKIRDTVVNSAKQKNCLVAINAGFFNTHTGACLGNLVSDGRKVQDSGGLQNTHFGITKNGSIFIGYLAEEEIQNGPGDFLQLVTGVGWILRNGYSFTNVSKYLECEDIEETGTVEKFINVLSARTVVGHDKEGRVVIVQIDGKTLYDGVSLWDLEDILKELGLVNAINLDGGGSATYVINNTVVNYPSDKCSDKRFNCERKVSSILCVHEPDCTPIDCNSHGQCIKGQCLCDQFWKPPDCKQLFCDKKNCSEHGLCTVDGCKCSPGWRGEDCESICQPGWYGQDCQRPCLCVNGGTCNRVTGECHCSSGFVGEMCERATCTMGKFTQQHNLTRNEAKQYHSLNGMSSGQNRAFSTPSAFRI
ncbi:N-acetylglucosamine-1-phosphodiester alpha-N-acetylglucosaminidase-like isoform X2 [Tachypleus tridentatus]|uniref:N-acetylglucosamine-1-phosphodiester alpha-N-acetylglucosaminidase-like isoform X2 n=1 Tax=Tachypleus tridentatus TaxID=6853 RepID=UPI003FD44881